MATTTRMTAAMWFHDADEQEEDRIIDRNVFTVNDDCVCMNDEQCDCEKCYMLKYQKYWDEERTRMAQFKYGVCMDCGVGLDDASQFFYDRSEQRCDCYTCDKCFEQFFGQDALFEAANWKTLGKPATQYVRIGSLV